MKPELMFPQRSALAGKPFRAKILAHGYRGAVCLCIGAEGFDEQAFVCLLCEQTDYERFPVGTLFDLVRVTDLG